MTFSTEVKKELSNLNNLNKKEELKYELIGYIASKNTINDKKNIKYSTESEYNINRFAKLIRNLGIEDFSISIQGKIYNIVFKKEKIEDLLKKYKITETEDIENLKSILRGMFLGSGSINNPEKKYHLEIELASENDAKYMVEKLETFDIKLKRIDKIIYLKDSEEISKFLAFIGAGKSVINFEEIRVKKEMKNKINRLVNCKSANLNKIINASVEQIEAIKKLKESNRFEKLDESLKEIANLRLEHPDLSLEELGKLLKSPIGKSGVNYRLKKIVELAND